MTKKLDSATALALVGRIETLEEMIEGAYTEARTYAGENNDAVIADAVAARKQQREAAHSAAALLGSFDFNDAGERVSEPPRSAWAAISARMKEGLAAVPESKTRRYIEKQIATLDKMEAFAISQGLPIITEEQLDAASGRGLAKDIR